MPREFKTKFMMNLGITFGALAVLGGLIIYLGYDISAKAYDIGSIRSTLLSNTSDAKNLNSLRTDAKEAAPFLDKLKAILPSRDSLFTVQKDFQTLAQNNQLAFSSQFSAEIPETATQLGKIRLEMLAQGEYNGILEFVKGVDASKYFTNIVNMDLVRQGNKFNANLTAEISFHD